MNRPSLRRTILLAAVLTSFGATSEARAQSADPQTLAAAQALYDRAVKAMGAKDYASACPNLEEVVRLVPEGLGAKLTLAECYEASDRLASAWTMYTLVDSAAVKPNQAQHKRTAHKQAEALKTKLAQLTVVVADAVRALPGIEISRDGVSMGAAQWGVPLPVDKGKHAIVVTATGKQKLEKTVEIEADGVQRSVEITDLADVPSAAPAPAAQETPPPVVDTEAIAKRAKVQRTAAFVAGGLGIVGLGIGAGFGIQAIVKKNESNAKDTLCRDGDLCSPAGQQLRNDGLAAGTRSTALFIAGGVALAAGVTLFLTTPRVPPIDAKVAVGPTGFELRGSW